MPKRLLGLRRSQAILPLEEDESGFERRIDPRHDFTGHDVRMFFGKMGYMLRLKDLSCKGLCGLTDAPVAPGEIVSVVLEEPEHVAAEIRWVRNALIGAAFLEPIEAEQMQKFRLKVQRWKRRR